MDAETRTPSAEEMAGRMVRFKDITPRPKLGAGLLPENVHRIHDR